MVRGNQRRSREPPKAPLIRLSAQKILRKLSGISQETLSSGIFQEILRKLSGDSQEALKRLSGSSQEAP